MGHDQVRLQLEMNWSLDKNYVLKKDLRGDNYGKSSRTDYHEKRHVKE